MPTKREITKPTLVERFTDNGEHSHWALVETLTGQEVWTSLPTPDQGIVNDWKSVEFPPKLKTFYNEDNHLVRQVSIEVLVSDGETVWTESFNEDFGFHESITFWKHFPPPPTVTPLTESEDIEALKKELLYARMESAQLMAKFVESERPFYVTDYVNQIEVEGNHYGERMVKRSLSLFWDFLKRNNLIVSEPLTESELRDRFNCIFHQFSPETKKDIFDWFLKNLVNWDLQKEK